MATPWSRDSGLEKLHKAGLKPATLGLEAAAAYLGMTPRIFKREVEAGRAPAPLSVHCRSKLWSIKVLDRFLERAQDVPPDGEDANDPIMAAIDAHYA